MISVPDFAEVENSFVTTDAECPADSQKTKFIYWDPCLGLSPVTIDSRKQFIVPHLLVWAATLLVLLFFA